jgi:Putative Actinobacterial Holin-X, holin superfamily III
MSSPPTTPARDRDRPTGDLVKDLSAQVSTLVRQELELAKAELTVKGKQAGIGAGMFGGAGLFALYGVLALAGKSRTARAVPPVPEQTVETIKEDVRYTREHVAEARHAREEEKAR